MESDSGRFLAIEKALAESENVRGVRQSQRPWSLPEWVIPSGQVFFRMLARCSNLTLTRDSSVKLEHKSTADGVARFAPAWRRVTINSSWSNWGIVSDVKLDFHLFGTIAALPHVNIASPRSSRQSKPFDKCVWTSLNHRSVRSMFDAFISYSHAADGKLAAALQHGLHRFAKPLFKRRAIRVSRSQASKMFDLAWTWTNRSAT